MLFRLLFTLISTASCDPTDFLNEYSNLIVIILLNLKIMYRYFHHVCDYVH